MREMRVALALVLLVATARAGGFRPLPKPTDLPTSPSARDRAWKLYVGCSIEDPGCLDPWTRAATLDPSNAELRAELAEHYFRTGDADAARSILDQLKASACRDCLAALIKRDRAWSRDAAFSADVAKGIRGRRTRYSPAAATITAALRRGDWKALAPFIPPRGVRWEPDSGVMKAPALERYMERVRSEQSTIRTSGLTTCEGDCCYETWDMLGGDEPAYLMGMCFAPGPILVSTQWDSLR